MSPSDAISFLYHSYFISTLCQIWREIICGYLSMLTLGWEQPNPSDDFTTKNSRIYSSYPHDATSHSENWEAWHPNLHSSCAYLLEQTAHQPHQIWQQCHWPIVQIQVCRLQPQHEGIICERWSIDSTWFSNPRTKHFSFQKITRECEISPIIRTWHEKPTLVVSIEGWVEQILSP